MKTKEELQNLRAGLLIQAKLYADDDERNVLPVIVEALRVVEYVIGDWTTEYSHLSYVNSEKDGKELCQHLKDDAEILLKVFRDYEEQMNATLDQGSKVVIHPRITVDLAGANTEEEQAKRIGEVVLGAMKQLATPTGKGN